MTGGTSRGDTIYGVTLAVLSVVMVALGAGVLLMGKQHLAESREELSRALVTVSAEQHRSPRDARVLQAVARRLPSDVRVVPETDFARTGRLTLAWHRLHREVDMCIVVPVDPRAPIAPCKRVPSHTPRPGVG
ncbi:MAG: hypothetical protein JWP11_826 [Frankiales bacterium]|jgi:hypothetical protein|nr:hypothetical protein [Frankiales bacterium]